MIDITASDRKRIGAILKQLRDAYGLEDKDLAAISGINVNTVSGILEGDRPFSPQKIERLASDFGFSSLEDLLTRGEKAAAEVAAGHSAYMDKTAAAITKIMEHREIGLTKLAPAVKNERGSSYSRNTLMNALGQKKLPTHFRAHQAMVSALGLASTDEAIRLADTLPQPQSPETFDYARAGKALQDVARLSDVHDTQICQMAGISRGELGHIFLGDKKCAIRTYEKVAQALGELGALDAGNCERAVQVAEYIDQTLMHLDHFPEILKAYRARRDMSQSELGAVVYPHMKEATGGNEISKLEKDRPDVSKLVARRVLRRLGFENMHQLIDAAGLSKKYPNPGAPLVTQGLSGHIDRLFKGVREENDLNFSLQELARRQGSQHTTEEPER